MADLSERMRPRLHEQAIEIYQTMKANSETNEKGEFVWRGAFTALVREHGVADGSYGKLRSRLEKLGCVTFLQRGNSTQPSMIVLHYSPKDIEWSRRLDLTSPDGAAMLSQRVADMHRRLGNIDVTQALITLTEDSQKLEQRIRKTELSMRRLAVKLGVDPKEIEID